MAYNGWSNYETWVVKLWMDNEEPSYRYWNEQAREALECENPGCGKCIRTLAEQLKAEHEEALPDLQGFAADLLNAAFGEVDWYEIAESLLNDARENIPVEAEG